MPPHDLNIPLLLECSKQQDELIAGHQREMSQVLTNKEHLRTALACEHKKRMALEAENFELKNKLPNFKPKTNNSVTAQSIPILISETNTSTSNIIIPYPALQVA